MDSLPKHGSRVERDVLKSIFHREALLQNVASQAVLVQDGEVSKLHAHRIEGQPIGLVDLCNDLRVASVEAVDAIVEWRNIFSASPATRRPKPFNWNGQNYLVKMARDCDFLAAVPPLVDEFKVNKLLL
jgi:hypothetical protein